MDTSKKAVIFIHGYMGSCRQYDGILQGLGACGAPLINLTLPGHGTTFEDFLQSRGRDWLSFVEEQIDRLRESCDEIILVGHSMGGLLAVSAAVAHPEKISQIIALGFPLGIKVTPVWIKNGFRASRPKRENETPIITAARQMSGIRVAGFSGYIRALPRSAEFMKVVGHTKKVMGSLKTPLTVINFKNDEIVAHSTQSRVKALLPTAKFILLEHSWHFLFGDDDLQLMVDEIRLAIDKQT